MPDYWRPIEVILPDRLTQREALDSIEAQIRVNAADAGDFVEKIQIGRVHPHSEGWSRWSARYLSGRPTAFFRVDDATDDTPESPVTFSPG